MELPAQGLQLVSTVTEAGAVELSLAEVEVPAPAAGQVLVQVEAAPINPSDLGLLLAGADPAEATFGGTAERPVVSIPLSPGAFRGSAARVGIPMAAGNEGAGTVVAAGDDPVAQALAGKIVAAAGGAMYSQYRVVDAAFCLELPAGATAADGAASFVNPMTVLGMIETMRMEGHSALVHTAAASNLGQMLVRACREDGIPLVNIVRSPAQADLLREAGAVHVCDSSADDFSATLVDAVRETGATLAFDAIGGGTLASRILAAMEEAQSAGAAFSRYGSTVHKQVYLYGGLDRGPTELIRSYGMAWGVGGWLLTTFLGKAGLERMVAMRDRVAAGLTTTFASHFAGSLSLAGALTAEALSQYGRQATGLKYLVTPQA
jgi:NADPH2:quinone reductase